MAKSIFQRIRFSEDETSGKTVENKTGRVLLYLAPLLIIGIIFASVFGAVFEIEPGTESLYLGKARFQAVAYDENGTLSFINATVNIYSNNDSTLLEENVSCNGLTVYDIDEISYYWVTNATIPFAYQSDKVRADDSAAGFLNYVLIYPKPVAGDLEVTIYRINTTYGDLGPSDIPSESFSMDLILRNVNMSRIGQLSPVPPQVAGNENLTTTRLWLEVDAVIIGAQVNGYNRTWGIFVNGTKSYLGLNPLGNYETSLEIALDCATVPTQFRWIDGLWIDDDVLLAMS